MLDGDDLSFDTSGSELTDITSEVGEVISRLGGDGLCCLFLPHATAGLALFETGAGSETDVSETIGHLLPKDRSYSHRHGSAGHGADHVLPALISPSLTIPVADGRLELGTWQSIVLADTNADNAERKVLVRLLR